MDGREVIVVGASAGGVEALRTLIKALPKDLAAAVLVVLHLPSSTPSVLPSILARVSALPVGAAVDGEPLRRGRIYVAPAGRHLLLLGNRVSLTSGPAENGHRPAIDPLFRSAARSFGGRVAGVVLSGARDDGAAGLAIIVKSGGLAFVQEPQEALFPGMPIAAIDAAKPATVMPAAQLGAALAQTAGTVGRPTAEVIAVAAAASSEAGMADIRALVEENGKGSPAGYACPSCGGSLFEIEDLLMPRFRCRIGHAWSPESLVEEQAAALESSLWIALRALQEKAALTQRMTRSSSERGNKHSAARFQAISDESTAAAVVLRDLIDRVGPAAAKPAHGHRP